MDVCDLKRTGALQMFDIDEFPPLFVPFLNGLERVGTVQNTIPEALRE